MTVIPKPNTRDLSLFSASQLKDVAAILGYWRTNKDRTRLISFPISIELNFESATVFVVDEHFHSAIIQGSYLVDYLVCGCLGEGFREQMFERGGCCRTLALLDRTDSVA